MAKTIMFNPLGGPLSARSEAGHGTSGSYRLMIFERDGFTIVPPSPIGGQFKVGVTNVDALPGTPSQNDGRFIQMLASVGVFEPERAYALHLTITQDGQDLDHEDDVGVDEGDEATHETDKIIVHLIAKPPQAAMNVMTSNNVSLLDSLKSEVLGQLVDTVAAAVPRGGTAPKAKKTAKKKGGDN
jgi:hypothetical protein